MCFTTCGPVRHSKNAPGLSVTQRWPWIALRAFGHCATRYLVYHRRPRLSHCVLWPDTARRFVEINPHRPAHDSHPP
jgi:hypothetical protein